MSSTAPLRAALYVRISEDPDDLQAGVKRQKADCQAYAERQGWTVVDVFEDNDTPAYNNGGKRPGKKRDDYHRLLAAVRAHRFDVVVGYHSSRWHRDVMEYFEFVQLLKQTGIAWHTAMEGEIRFSSATDDATSTVRAVFNQLESALKSERIRRQKLDAAIAGQHNGGIRCFGYEGGKIENGGGMIIRENEADEIRRIADAIIAGQSLRSLAIELNERGIPTVKGSRALERGELNTSRWTAQHLRATLMRPRLAGLRAHKGKLYPAQWPAILDQTTWEATKAVLDDPGRRTGGSGRRGPVPSTLGTGIYRCGVCGEPRMRLGGSKSRRGVYKCGNVDSVGSLGHVTRVAESVDTYVTDVLLRKLSEPGVIDAICATFDSDDANRAALVKERDAITKELKALAARCDAGDIDDEQLAIASRRRRARRDEITDELKSSGRRSALEAFREHPDESVEQVWNEYLTLGVQRAILDEVLTVTIKPMTGGGRAPDGSYFNPDGLGIELTERARKCTTAVDYK